MPRDLTDDQSTWLQVMAWCRQATSHYLSQCWPRSLSSYCITRSQWVNDHMLWIFLTSSGVNLKKKTATSQSQIIMRNVNIFLSYLKKKKKKKSARQGLVSSWHLDHRYVLGSPVFTWADHSCNMSLHQHKDTHHCPSNLDCYTVLTWWQ